MVRYALFIDDNRNPPRDGLEWGLCRTIEDMRSMLSERGVPSIMSFDYDLSNSEIHLMGSDALSCFLDDIKQAIDCPKTIEVRFHTSSVMYKKKMIELLKERHSELLGIGVDVQYIDPSERMDRLFGLK